MSEDRMITIMQQNTLKDIDNSFFRDIFSCPKVAGVTSLSHTISLPIRLGGLVETVPSDMRRIPDQVMF